MRSIILSLCLAFFASSSGAFDCGSLEEWTGTDFECLECDSYLEGFQTAQTMPEGSPSVQTTGYCSLTDQSFCVFKVDPDEGSNKYFLWTSEPGGSVPSSSQCNSLVNNWPAEPADPGQGSSGPPQQGGEDPPGGGANGQQSPVVFDLGNNGFLFTGRKGAVRFDVDRDGDPDLVSWTDTAGDEAFLALDRNGNGVVDDGGELFGNYTDQLPTSIPNGFNALRSFDSDGDLQITPADPVFHDLILWRDADGDGVSQYGELSALSDHDISWIRLDAFVTGRTDEHGNLLWFISRAGAPAGPIKTVDVFFVEYDD